MSDLQRQSGSQDKPVTVGVVQLCCGPDFEHNLRRAVALSEEAAEKGARIIFLPEYVDGLAADEQLQVLCRHAADNSRILIDRFGKLAIAASADIVIGSLREPATGGKVYNTSIVIGKDGKIARRYQKIHLFDVVLPGNISVRESEMVCPGEQVETAEVAGFKLGLSVCFDVRFSGHYDRLRRLGAEIIAIPAAFAEQTGRSHWSVLLRARAIETQCYIVAPAQSGTVGRRTYYGHSSIIDPWGNVLCCKDSGEGVVMATLDRANISSVRASIPMI